VVIAVAGLACGACGTTVQSLPTAAGDGLSVTTATQPSAAAAVAPDVQAAGPGSSSAPPPSLGPSSVSAPLPAGDAPSIRVPGVSTGEVAIGYSTSKAVGALAASLGLKGVNPGDTEAQVQAVVKDLNARGGLLGHRIVLKKYDVSTDSNAQAMCSYWTQDNHVFAVVDAVNAGAPVLNDGLAACLSGKHVPLLTGAPLISRLAYDKYPYVVAPDHASSERYMTGLVDRIAGLDFFHGWDNTLGRPSPAPVKIGINSFDTPGDQSRAKALQAALHHHGYDNVYVEKYSSDLTALPAATQSAVLRFKAEGVTHVFGANVLFYQDAQSQGFHPRYAVDDTANTVQLMAQNAPQAQLHGALGGGYLPMSEDDSFTAGTAAARRCLGLMSKAGIDVTDRFAVTYMLAICDRFWVLERALKAGGTLSPLSFLSGLGRLPAGIDSAGTYAMTLVRRDGAFRLRAFTYVDSCTCFRLTGSATPF
jgi:hypothetical protein